MEICMIVLILVLMEWLQVPKVFSLLVTDNGLNPCSDGMASSFGDVLVETISIKVLILVLMEWLQVSLMATL